MLKPLLAAFLLLAAPAMPQSGRFPVFGPSAEREAFFAAQAKAEAARVAALEAQRHEAELARLALEAARAGQAAAEARARQTRRLAHCNVIHDRPIRQDTAGPGGAAPTLPPARILCPGSPIARPWPGVQPDLTEIGIHLDDGDLAVRGRILRPGLSLGFALD